MIVGKPGDNWRVNDPKFSLYIRPVGNGCFTIELSPEARIGVSTSDNQKVVGNKNGQKINGLDQWKIVTAKEMK